MRVVDTSVWSRVWRRPKEIATQSVAGVTVARLVRDGVRLAVPGVVLQELLSGLKAETQLDLLAEEMRAYPLLLATREHHLLAAKMANTCRARGIATTSTDALIAATARLADAALLTFDLGFERMADCCGLDVSVLRDP